MLSLWKKLHKISITHVKKYKKSIGALIHLLDQSTYDDYNKYAESEQKAIPQQFPGILVWGTDIDFDRTGADLQRFDVITHVDNKRVVDLHTMYTALDRLDQVQVTWVSASDGRNNQG
ncbi:unnamed protein product [Medioppia subpectinata]|uniref:PDZ domain-containing protein n=1 Tax=Medioppia subpectinata TaxID=1979941 RepID=A0A7R9KLH0_9ACAR|nr:unnamed protein product [Medioppia subpectinata]CAG2105779.1 unnamed protein product [Medioppia subpectinata]